MIPRAALAAAARLGARAPVIINRRWPLLRQTKRFLQRRLQRREVQVNGFRLRLDATDSLRLGLGEIHEAGVLRCFEELLRPGDLVVDGGAFIGYHSLHMARLVGSTGTVLAFEPDPSSYALLQANLAANHCLTVDARQAALWSRSCRRRLYLRDDHHADHRLYDSGDGRPSLEVQALELDQVLSESDDAPRLIKLDLQGSELHALRGMRRTIERSPELAVVLELWPRGLRGCGSSAAELLALLDEHGFGFWQIHASGHDLRRTTTAQLLRRLDPQHALGRWANALRRRDEADILCWRGEQPPRR